MSASIVDQVELFHKRLGHPSPTILCSPPFNKTPSDIKQLESCEICFYSKPTRSSFPSSSNKVVSIFDLIHCDLWGPYSTCLSSGSHYFLTIVDDKSRAIWVYLISDKSEVTTCIKNSLP